VEHASTPTTGSDRRWWILTIVMIAEIMDLLDGTIVNVAGPSLKRELGTSPSSLQWIIGGYTLALGAGLVLGGRLGDRYGKRPTFLLGMAGFTIASVLCATAPSTNLLIAYRVLEGLSGAFLLPQGIGFIRQAFPPQDLGKAFAAQGPIYGLGGILGPIIGGVLIQANWFNLNWRVVFLVNVPVGLFGCVAGYLLLPKGEGDRRVTIDLFGAAIIAVSSLLLILPLIQGRVDNWAPWTWMSLVGSLLGFYAFMWRDRVVERAGKTPLVMASLLGNRHYLVGIGSILLFFSGWTGVSLITTLFLQIGEHFNAGQAAVANIPFAVASAIGGMLSGTVLSDKLGRNTLHLGAVVQLLGMGLLYAALGNVTHFSIWHLVPGMTVVGFGFGLIVAALFQSVLSAISNAETGSASGLLAAVQAVGASAGVAIFGTVFFAKATSGAFALGFRHAILVEVIVIVVFMLAICGLDKQAPTNNWE